MGHVQWFLHEDERRLVFPCDVVLQSALDGTRGCCSARCLFGTECVRHCDCMWSPGYLGGRRCSCGFGDVGRCLHRVPLSCPLPCVTRWVGWVSICMAAFGRISPYQSPQPQRPLWAARVSRGFSALVDRLCRMSVHVLWSTPILHLPGLASRERRLSYTSLLRGPSGGIFPLGGMGVRSIWFVGAY